MIEALIGILFAACFVTFYLLISLHGRRAQRRSGTRLSELYPPALREAKTVDARRRLSKNTEELSRHHLVAGKASAPKMMKAAAERAGTERRQSAGPVS